MTLPSSSETPLSYGDGGAEPAAAYAGDPAPPRTGGALYAPVPAGPEGASGHGQAFRGGVIGARPPAVAVPPPPPVVENLLVSPAAAPPVAGVQAPARAESAAAPRVAQAAQVYAAQRALASTATATITPPTGAGWSAWQASALAVAPEIEPPSGHPGRPRKAARPAKAWALHTLQIVIWQIVIIGVLIAIQQPLEVMIPALCAAVLLLALTVPRSGGRWVYEWLDVWLRFSFRHRMRTMAAGSPINELLRPFLRGAQLGSIEIDDVDKAVLTHAGGVSVLLETTPADGGMFADSGLSVPPPTVLLPPSEESGGSPVSAQLVVQTTPAPGAYRAQGVVAHSYQALGQGMIPAHRRSWIALQALRTPADGGDPGDPELRATVLNAVQRLQRRLHRAGMRGSVLDGMQLTADLAMLSGAEAVRRGDGTASVRLQERWTSWSAGYAAQVTYRLLEWPDLATHSGREFFDRLVTLPSLTTTLGLAARRVVKQSDKPAEQAVELEGVLRVTVPQDQLDLLSTQLRELAGRHGVRVQRMNGEHAFGVAATLPLGGFVA